MQQVRAYKDGDQRWVIVIEGTDENLDDFVGNLVTGLAQGTIKPVELPEKPVQMITPEEDRAVLEEVEAARTTPPRFVRELQKEGEQAVQPAKEPAAEAAPDTGSDETDLLRANLHDRKLKELSFRMYHTADVGLVLRVKRQTEIQKLAECYEAIRNH